MGMCVLFSYFISLIYAWHLIFQGPSPVERCPSNKATKCGNAICYGMKSVTINAVAYISTLVCSTTLSYF